MMAFGWKIQYQIDFYVSMTHLNQTTCVYPCPYANLNFEMDLPPAPALAAVDFGYDPMDLNDVSADLEDIITMTSDKEILDPEDISDCIDDSQNKHWFA